MASNYWRNWARTQQCAPSAIAQPTTENELAAVVADAASRGETVKAIGAGHSFTDIACTSGVQVRLDGYNRLLEIDRETNRVKVQAGMSIHDLNERLDVSGLAMENLGDIAYQSIAGATATATHGTGARLSNISSQIVEMTLIDGAGQIIKCSRDENPDIFAAARVGVGALGMVSTITIESVPAFNLEATEQPMRLDDVLADLDAIIDDNDHFEFFYVPHTGWALTKTNNRTDRAPAPRTPVQHFRDKVVLENWAFGVLCRVGKVAPSLIPRLNTAVPSGGKFTYVDKSYKVFASPRSNFIRFNEMEYAVPREAGAEALQRVRRFIDETGLKISFPIEFRFTKGDDIALSTAAERDTCYIAVHVYQGTPNDQYFQGVERIMNDYDGRPHWGKMHYQSAETLAPRYPRWGEFQSIRAKLDPSGTFANDYTERVLGPL